MGHVVRRARRDADLSQRQLARYAEVPKSVIGDIETGVSVASFPVVERLLAACGYQVVIVDRRDGEVVELIDDDRRDRLGRRYPSHLDARELSPVELTERSENECRPRPLSEHTYRLNRLWRDMDRWHGYFGEAVESWRPPGPDKAYVRSVLGYEPRIPEPRLPSADEWLCPGIRTDLNATVRRPEDRYVVVRQPPVSVLLRELEERVAIRQARADRGG